MARTAGRPDGLSKKLHKKCLSKNENGGRSGSGGAVDQNGSHKVTKKTKLKSSEEQEGMGAEGVLERVRRAGVPSSEEAGCMLIFAAGRGRGRPGGFRLQTSDVGTVDLDDVSDLWDVDELVDEPLSVHLGEDAALIVVPVESEEREEVRKGAGRSLGDRPSPERPSHRLVIHVGLVLVHAPQPRDGLGVDQLENALLAVGPLDEAGAALLVLQQLQEKLPQVGGGALAGLALQGDAVGAHLLFPGRTTTTKKVSTRGQSFLVSFLPVLFPLLQGRLERLERLDVVAGREVAGVVGARRARPAPAVQVVPAPAAARVRRRPEARRGGQDRVQGRRRGRRRAPAVRQAPPEAAVRRRRAEPAGHVGVVEHGLQLFGH